MSPRGPWRGLLVRGESTVCSYRKSQEKTRQRHCCCCRRNSTIASLLSIVVLCRSVHYLPSLSSTNSIKAINARMAEAKTGPFEADEGWTKVQLMGGSETPAVTKSKVCLCQRKNCGESFAVLHLSLILNCRL